MGIGSAPCYRHHRFPGLDALGNTTARLDLFPPQLPGLLQIHPDLPCRPELARQAQCGVGGHAPLPIQDRRDSIHRDVERL